MPPPATLSSSFAIEEEEEEEKIYKDFANKIKIVCRLTKARLSLRKPEGLLDCNVSK